MGNGETHKPVVGQVTVVGTGLLGASIGLGLRKAGFAGRVVGVGRRRETIDRAVKLGCFEAATTNLEAAVADARGTGQGQLNLIVLATPLGAFAELLEQLGKLDLAGAVVTDVGSTKQQVCDAAARLLPEPRRFVGSHPMAGGEQQGPQAAKADLFAGKPCIVTAADNAEDEAANAARWLWRLLQMRTVHMPAAMHDRLVAQVSHLPHAAAVLLVELASRDVGLDIASTGFRDTTRVASGDPDLWVDIFSSNREAMIEAVNELATALDQFKQMLVSDDRGGMQTLLERVRTAREQWLRNVEVDHSGSYE